MTTTRLLATAIAILPFLLGTEATADTEKYRLSWRDDPATTMVVGWVQVGGAAESVHFDTVDHGTDWAAYAFSRAPDRSVNANGMSHRFARLVGLEPDTEYFFVIRDDESVSERMRFRTAPDRCSEFTFVAGGDSRNNQEPRRDANQIVSKLRPLFVAFGGDYVFDGDDDREMEDWLDDWQDTRSSDGRMYPIVATRGNHERSSTVVDIFDVPHSNVYYALSFGGQQLRTYTLNSEITEGGAQGAWLADDLANQGSQHVFRTAQYHKPMRPHQSGKSEGNNEYSAWAQLFFDHRMDLVVECDSHVVKRTWPVRPSTGPGNDEGFVRDDDNGTTFIGEGCWGAPLRADNDSKAWTRATGSFNQVSWVHVLPSEIQVRTVRTANPDTVDSVDDADPLAIPAGLNTWSPGSGEVVVIPARLSGLGDTDGDGVADACDACPLDSPDDSDGDGACDSDDLCPGFDDDVDRDGDGQPDGCDPCPDDAVDDSDADGTCDSDDLCPGFDDDADGDGDAQPDGCDPCPDDAADDSDGDGSCDSDDLCPGFDDAVDRDGDTQPDGCDPCPDDAPDDSDGDGSCDSNDLCPGFDDGLDTDGDAQPDGCDPCPDDPADDSDGDGSCDSDDLCPGFDDDLDTDGDAQPDGCDPCPDDAPDDSDGDGSCDSDDLCPGFDDDLDGDGDAQPDGCDPCPDDAPDDSDADGVCDSDDACPGSDDRVDGDSDAVPDGCDTCPGFDDAIGVPAAGPGPSLRLGPEGLSWAPVANATEHPIHRGTIPRAGGMASRGVPHDHACVDRVAGTTWGDPDAPAPGRGSYYLVGAANPCGPAAATLGRDARERLRPVPLCP